MEQDVEQVNIGGSPTGLQWTLKGEPGHSGGAEETSFCPQGEEVLGHTGTKTPAGSPQRPSLLQLQMWKSGKDSVALQKLHLSPTSHGDRGTFTRPHCYLV